ncbi:MAG: hypothetical protein IPI00_17840 [Flavobacteriales bacterium]|nr:hypothetical protein [Flavobacteriales bacterium]
MKDNLAEAEERSEALIQRVAAAEQIRELEGKREQAIANLEQVNEDLNEELMFYHKRMFTSKWVLKGTEPLFASYSIKYGAYDKKKLELRAELQVRLEQETQLKRKMQTRLPIDVPEPIHVERMLEAERCLVCDRVAERGSEAWNKIKELLDRTHDENKALEEEAHTVHDFSPDLKRLYNNGLALAPSVQGVDRDIANTRKQIKKYETRRKVISQDLDKLAASIQELISNSALDINAAKNLLHDYTAQSENVRRFDREAGNLGHDIASLKEARDKINEQLQALVTGELPAYLEEKVKVLTEFHMVTHSTRDRVFKQLVSELEKEANTHYADMTKGNLSARGIIHLKELANGNYMPELVDDQGNALLNLNTGNIILIKLATIMAIISARQGTRATDLYTLITDAPMSVFGEDYTLGFCRTVSKVYRQSIIMSKEFYKNIALRDQLFNDPEIKLGKVYEITPSIPEAERANRNSLATIIKALN